MEWLTESVGYPAREAERLADRLCEKYPRLLRRESLGKTVLGREIPLLRIGHGKQYVLLTGGTHGSEYLTATLLFFFMEDLCESLTNGQPLGGLRLDRLLGDRGVLVVPSVNPDGCEIALRGEAGAGTMAPSVRLLAKGDTRHWNANARGVDINHNFDAGWAALHAAERKAGYLGPGPTRYGGPSPESEPETHALCELCRREPIAHALSFHSQGEVIYWHYGDPMPPRSRAMAELFATASGYALDVPTGLAIGGGFKDWFLHTFHRPAFTVEVGHGQNPLPIESAYTLYAELRTLLALSVAV